MHVLVKDKEERAKPKKIHNVIFYSNDPFSSITQKAGRIFPKVSNDLKTAN